MIHNRSQIIFIIVIVFAFIGLVSMLMNNPMVLLTSLVVTAAFVGFFLLLFHLISGSRNFINQRSRNKRYNEQRAYMKAVKYSRRKYGKKQPNRRKDKMKHTGRRRHAPHLTVIEGKKSKKKDRALH